MWNNGVQKGATMSTFAEDSIMSYFAEIEEPRSGENLSHPLINILTIAVLGVICGADGWVDVERYGEAKKEWLSTFLDLKKGIPSHDTFGRVFSWIKPEQFEACFIAWTDAIRQKTGGEVVSFDGKKLRRSQDGSHDRAGIWMVSAWMEANRMVLGQHKVDAKSNEVTAIPALLAQLDITGCIVTIDAMGAQTEIAKAIVKANANYILSVKQNQRALHEDLSLLFEGFEQDDYRQVEFDSYKQVTEGHDRREIRHCWVVHHPDYLSYLRRAQRWEGLKSVVKLMTIRQRGDKTQVSTRYFISSWTGSAQDFLRCVRGHWHIENGLHWVLDIAFREDDSRIRNQYAPQNMAVLRHLALNLLKQDRSVKVGIAAKRKMAGWDNDYLLKVLCP
jgi:predicted transposase YbfD/YdcC